MRLRLRVREVAIEKGFSMGKLERAAGLSHPTVRDVWRKPDEKDISLSTLAKLATALGVHAYELFEEIPD
jgi:transcriptional regulator with XRE-family HTH domain